MQDEISVQVIFEFSRANLRNSKFDQRGYGPGTTWSNHRDLGTGCRIAHALSALARQFLAWHRTDGLSRCVLHPRWNAAAPSSRNAGVNRWFRSATRRLGECGRTEVASGNDSFV